MFATPTSSPKMTRMFGRLPEGCTGAGVGCCACAVVARPVGLSADAAVPLTRLRNPECVLGEIRAGLALDDGLLGANLARGRARDAVAGLPPSVGACFYY